LLFPNDPQRQLTGENASLRFALAVARNVAREEIRRARTDRLVSVADLDEIPEAIKAADVPSEPWLRRAIEHCIEQLPERPRKSLMARLGAGAESDAVLALRTGMTRNTFLQNIVRARRALAACLEGRGFSMRGLTA
jgi:DNA-directed RNA polymerase specialized sigma24 family protein